jgi:TusA-related sulfurtransferase
MGEAEVLDACGLSCPMPAMLARRALLSKQRGVIEVLVDNAASSENVARTARREGWTAEIHTEVGGRFRLRLSRQ